MTFLSVQILNPGNRQLKEIICESGPWLRFASYFSFSDDLLELQQNKDEFQLLCPELFRLEVFRVLEMEIS
jgi:hypothetical protein